MAPGQENLVFLSGVTMGIPNIIDQALCQRTASHCKQDYMVIFCCLFDFKSKRLRQKQKQKDNEFVRVGRWGKI